MPKKENYNYSETKTDRSFFGSKFLNLGKKKDLPVEKALVNCPPKVDMATAKGIQKARGPKR